MNPVFKSKIFRVIIIKYLKVKTTSWMLIGVVFRCLDSIEMSALSVRAPGLQATTTVLDTRSLRVRGVTALDGVRRNLFGCTDREENRRFVERELARQLELDSQRWGFDFANEQPLPGIQRFAWQLVPASAVPVALRRSPITTSMPKQNTSTQEAKVSSPESTKTQKRITGKNLIYVLGLLKIPNASVSMCHAYGFPLLDYSLTEMLL
uniref:Cyclin-dependent kinase inhibitor domain-containing protein n=1 Tax=Bombyx mori TaxID=7091 RepID=A0A8R2DPU3_BOMMO|nr:uncharacterized protein LOC101739436 isoform X2 [Bombyx mori]